MGITSPQFPNENCPQGDCERSACNPDPGMNDDGTDVAGVCRLHDVPRPAAARADHGPGRRSGRPCSSASGARAAIVPICGRGRIPSRALERGDLPPVLGFPAARHGKPRRRHRAEPGDREARCAPRRSGACARITTYLHDGRATTLDAAILAHDGQGKKARNRYASLPAYQKTWLAAFLNSL